MNNIDETELELIKKRMEQLGLLLSTQSLNLKPNEKSFEYYKGFYDATTNFMQTFEKLIEVGTFSGTKFNSNN